ncbi:MAG: glycerol-3-phosphate 1-O-acyltransferase PlsY [Vicinamibacterales bacterium]
METFGPILFGYGIGSLPIGYLIASRLRGIDLRRVGSGNVGATNVYRTAGLAVALLVMALDMAKGAGSVFLVSREAAGGAAPVAAGVAAVIGHVYPIWLRFRGGKGVATAAGVFAVLAPFATLLAASVFVVTVWITRYVSLGSVVATAALPPLAWMANAPLPVVVGGVIAALLVIERHRGNLARLQAGTERRLGQRA